MQTYRIRRAISYHVLLILLIGGLAASTTEAHSQKVFITGGDVLTSNSDIENDPALQPGFKIGSRLWLTDLLQVQGAVTYQDFVSVEATVLAYPFPTATIEPYAFLGFGGFFDSEKDLTVVPAGLGVEYHLSNDLGLLFEVTGRWTLRDPGTFRGANLSFGLMPSMGISYNLRGFKRPAPDAIPPERTLPPLPNANTPAVAVADTTRPVRQQPSRRQQPARRPRQAQRDIMPNGCPLIEGDSLSLTVQNDMVLIPDGIFIMGLTDEDPLQLQTAGLRRITLSQFYIDQYEVSNADYLRFLSENGQASLLPDTTMGRTAGNRFSWSEYLRGSAYTNHPVVGVNHDQAAQYCAYYNKRLPTEAEWEYAARSGQIGGVYPWDGLEIRDVDGQFRANYNPGRGGYAADGFAFTAPVNAFPPSDWCLYNVSGNVAEWVQDNFHPTYSTLSDINPLHTAPNEPQHVIRGGSWGSDAFYIGLGVRDAQSGDEASPYVGFRCVQDVSDLQE
jgi:formylglycine-generating enzyme required for sulfatase activity